MCVLAQVPALASAFLKAEERTFQGCSRCSGPHCVKNRISRLLLFHFLIHSFPAVFGSGIEKEKAIKVFPIHTWWYTPVIPAVKTVLGSWEDGSAVKSTCCSCRGSEFASQHPRDGAQASVTLIPGIWCPLLNSSAQELCVHILYIDSCRQNMDTHKPKRIKNYRVFLD